MKDRFDQESYENQSKIETLMTVTSGFKKYMDYALYLISDLSKYYVLAKPQIRAKIVCSIFPEKVPFFNKTNRTPKINRAIELITQRNKQLSSEKKGLSVTQSLSVEGSCKVSNLYGDLQAIYDYNLSANTEKKL